MRKLQNTLYITTQGSYLHKERETLVVEQERKKVAQLPVHSIGHIFCFGNVLVSPFLLGFCGENNVNLGRFLPKTDVSWGGFRGGRAAMCCCVGRSIGCRSKIPCRLRAISLRRRFRRVSGCFSGRFAITARMRRFKVRSML